VKLVEMTRIGMLSSEYISDYLGLRLLPARLSSIEWKDSLILNDEFESMWKEAVMTFWNYNS
jgi:hypothetical protein